MNAFSDPPGGANRETAPPEAHTANGASKDKRLDVLLRDRIGLLERTLGSLTEIEQAADGSVSADQIHAFLGGEAFDARRMAILTAAVTKVETIRGVSAARKMSPGVGRTKADSKAAEARTASSATSRAAVAQSTPDAAPGAPEARGEARGAAKAKPASRSGNLEDELRRDIKTLEREFGPATIDTIAHAARNFVSKEQIRAFLDGGALDARSIEMIDSAAAEIKAEHMPSDACPRKGACHERRRHSVRDDKSDESRPYAPGLQQ